MVAPPSPRYVGPPKWCGSKTNRPIRRIVIHCTAGAEPGTTNAALNTVAYSKRTSRASSYHYIADAGRSYQYVWDSWVAYHAPPNSHSIGYELCCSLSNEGRGHWSGDNHRKMLRICAKDVARLCLAYDIPIRKVSASQLRAGAQGICGHNDVRDAWHQTSHWDPGPHFPWKDFIDMVKQEARAVQNDGKPSRGGRVDTALKLLREAEDATGKNHHTRRRKLQRAIRVLTSIKPV